MKRLIEFIRRTLARGLMRRRDREPQHLIFAKPQPAERPVPALLRPMLLTHADGAGGSRACDLINHQQVLVRGR